MSLLGAVVAGLGSFLGAKSQSNAVKSANKAALKMMQPYIQQGTKGLTELLRLLQSYAPDMTARQNPILNNAYIYQSNLLQALERDQTKRALDYWTRLGAQSLARGEIARAQLAADAARAQALNQAQSQAEADRLSRLAALLEGYQSVASMGHNMAANAAGLSAGQGNQLANINARLWDNLGSVVAAYETDKINKRLQDLYVKYLESLTR